MHWFCCPFLFLLLIKHLFHWHFVYLSFKFYLLNFYVIWCFAFMLCLCTPWVMLEGPGGQNWVSDPQELDLQTAVSCPVGAGSQNPALWEQPALLTTTDPSLHPPCTSLIPNLMLLHFVLIFLARILKVIDKMFVLTNRCNKNFRSDIAFLINSYTYWFIKKNLPLYTEIIRVTISLEPEMARRRVCHSSFNTVRELNAK